MNLYKAKGKLRSVNVRQELHGDEHRLACDIGLEFDQPNRFLDKLDTRLLETFYWKNPSGQLTLDGCEVSDFPNLRFAEMLGMPIKWTEEFGGSAFTLHSDVNSGDTVMRDVSINKVRLTPKEGGTVSVAVRIQGHPEEDELAHLCSALQSAVTFTVESNPDDETVEQQAEREGKVIAKKAKKAAKPLKGNGAKATVTQLHSDDPKEQARQRKNAADRKRRADAKAANAPKDDPDAERLKAIKEAMQSDGPKSIQ